MKGALGPMKGHVVVMAVLTGDETEIMETDVGIQMFCL